MSPPKRSQRLRWMHTAHRWLALIVGLQIGLWAISGAYMVMVDLDIIHGNHLIDPQRHPLQPDDLPLVNKQIQLVKEDFSSVISLKSQRHSLGQAYWVNQGNSAEASMASVFESPPLTEAHIRLLATTIYSGTASVSSSRLITKDGPREYGSRALPVWQIQFDDGWQTTLYLHPVSGQLITKRHRLWRWFDFFWMLHIMDYQDRDNPHNLLLQIVGLFSLGVVLSGSVYLGLRLKQANARRLFKLRGDRVSFIHRLLGLIIGAQLILWVVSGLLLSIIDPPPRLAAVPESPPQNADWVDITQITSLIDEAIYSITLKTIHQTPVYQLELSEKVLMVRTSDGKPFKLTQSHALKLAHQQLGLSAPVTVSQRSSGTEQEELRLDYDDDEATTVTFSAANDYRLKRQNQRSRWRDLLFTLHFMDYMSTSNQSDFNHLLIRIAALLTLVFAFSGWILMIRQRRRLSLR